MIEDDVVDLIRLPPDAGLVQSLGAHHTLESAIADLVDNSIDAGATKVVIRLLTRDDRLTRIEVLDNGAGMDSESITDAMTTGHRRAYTSDDLGHFGMGLKAASFAHADTLTVWSNTALLNAVGRRIRRDAYSSDFSCEVLSDAAAGQAAGDRLRALGVEPGTTVVWSQLRNAYRGRNAPEARAWLSAATTALRIHLGVIFHRLLEQERLQIDVVADEAIAIDGAVSVPVLAIDPFGYGQSGHPRYPKKLTASTSDSAISLSCHIWPARSEQPGFRIGGKPGEQFQGFFIYRNDRLLQVGGWSDIANPNRERQLARVILDNAEAYEAFLTMNPEKSGMKFETSFYEATSRSAADDGTTFIQYLADAEAVYAESKRRRRRREPAIMPDKGFAPALRKTIRNELPMIEGDTLRLQWVAMPVGEFLNVEFRSKTLWVNSRYRALFAPERGSLNDAPVLKALLYLLTHHVFEGQHLGPKDKDEIALWESVLGAAAEAEQRMRIGS